jgi:predicted dienelactone hydrolase
MSNSPYESNPSTEGYSMIFAFRNLIAMLALTGAIQVKATETAYSPLDVPADWKSATIDLVVQDKKRNRDIPIRVYLPASKVSAPVVIFSHGLGGSREGNPYLGNHWSARGYVVVFIQHIGSDVSVWKDIPVTQRLSALRTAANLKNTVLRFQDIPATIDELERWVASSDHQLAGRLDLNHLGMSGHSFGAVTTQGVAGQRTARGSNDFTDTRIKSAIMMSPNGPKGLGELNKIFGGVTIPWFLMTGTKDVAIVGDADVESRLSVFPALPEGNKYQLVFKDGEHEAFSDHALPLTQKKRNPNHHRAILALSTAFWDAFLKDDPNAKLWLNGNGPRTILEKDDQWDKK